VLWRHGRTAWNAGGLFQGQTDVDLDETGLAHAERAARMLASMNPAALVVSDLRRAVDTAAPLARITGLTPTQDPGLRETYAGAWQGLTMAQIRERFPDQAAAWERGESHAQPEGGESRVEVATRTVAALRRGLSGVPEDGTLVAITHGGAARVAICSLLGLPEAVWSAIGVLSNCCWSVLAESRTGWRLVEHNAGTLPEPVLSEEG
jgi:glucosyl-3-phosphoglycerate phosphatase